MWKILIERGNLGFSAAHFITFEDTCEPLHGHNYGVRVEVGGSSLLPESYLLDFGVLKNIVRTLCKEWDHLFLLPLQNPHLRLSEQADAWAFEYVPGESAPNASTSPLRYVLPKSSVVTLPVDNATAERLAEQLAQRIVAQLGERGLGANLDYVTVGIEETEMQTAFCTLTFQAGLDHPPG